MNTWLEPRYDGPHVVSVTDDGRIRCLACGHYFTDVPTTEEYCPAPAPIRDIYRMSEHLLALE